MNDRGYKLITQTETEQLQCDIMVDSNDRYTVKIKLLEPLTSPSTLVYIAQIGDKMGTTIDINQATLLGRLDETGRYWFNWEPEKKSISDNPHSYQIWLKDIARSEVYFTHKFTQ